MVANSHVLTTPFLLATILLAYTFAALVDCYSPQRFHHKYQAKLSSTFNNMPHQQKPTLSYMDNSIAALESVNGIFQEEKNSVCDLPGDP
jgi:hypothetical protein